MKKYKPVKFKIKHRGAPIVNNGYVLVSGDKLTPNRNSKIKSKFLPHIVALEFDLKSKYCEVSCTTSGSDGSVGLYIQANENSIHLDDKFDKDEPTGIEFPEYKGWEVFAAGIGRYTLRVCLIKKE